jgi:hypothetical protein
VIVAIVCDFGQKKGHAARYCRSKVYFDSEKADIATKRLVIRSQIVKEEGNSGDESDSVCLIGKNVGDSKISGMKWLIDSGASAHRTSCKDAMECYKSIPVSSISIGGRKSGEMHYRKCFARAISRI